MHYFKELLPVHHLAVPLRTVVHSQMYPPWKNGNTPPPSSPFWLTQVNLFSPCFIYLFSPYFFQANKDVIHILFDDAHVCLDSSLSCIGTHNSMSWFVFSCFCTMSRPHLLIDVSSEAIFLYTFFKTNFAIIPPSLPPSVQQHRRPYSGISAEAVPQRAP